MVCNDPDEPTKSQRQERRQHTRTKVAVEAKLHLEGGRAPLRVKTADLSLGGLYVEMMFTLETGTKLKIVLWMAHR
jgi:c-di-GMP-binding flagellar brake protein YcgR